MRNYYLLSFELLWENANSDPQLSPNYIFGPCDLIPKKPTGPIIIIITQLINQIQTQHSPSPPLPILPKPKMNPAHHFNKNPVNSHLTKPPQPHFPPKPYHHYCSIPPTTWPSNLLPTLHHLSLHLTQPSKSFEKLSTQNTDTRQLWRQVLI